MRVVAAVAAFGAEYGEVARPDVLELLEVVALASAFRSADVAEVNAERAQLAREVHGCAFLGLVFPLVPPLRPGRFVVAGELRDQVGRENAATVEPVEDVSSVAKELEAVRVLVGRRAAD